MVSAVRAFLVVNLFSAVSGGKRDYDHSEANESRMTITIKLDDGLPRSGDLLVATQ